MKKFRKLFGCLMIILALVVMQLPITEAEAATSVSDFSIDEEGILTKYNGIASSVVIPSGVKVIATDAFKNNSTVMSVSIPNSVTKIEAYAFWNCSKLNSVSIGTGLEEIGDFAFANCKALSTMIVPSNIKRIGLYAFEDDINLTDITIPYQTMDIHDTAFDGCSKLVIHAVEGSYAYKYAQDFYKRQQEFPEYEEVANYDPDGNQGNGNGDGSTGDVNGSSGSGNGGGSNGSSGDGSGTGNGSEAGNDSGAGSTASSEGTVVVVTNPDGTGASYITGGYGNQLSSVHIVGNKAMIFMDSSSPTVYFGNQSSVNVEDTADGSNNGTGAGDGLGPAIAEPDSLYENIIPKYTIVDGQIVADQAYYCSRSINYVVLPNTIKEIGQFAYARSTVSSIVLPDGLERIDYGAFYHCDKLSSVTIPDTVTFVEPKAFAYSAWVEEFFNASADNAGDSVSVSTSDASDFLISGGVLVAYRGASQNVAIPDGVRVIAAEVFEGHEEIESVSLPASLEYIGEEAFADCKMLSSVNLENTSIKSVSDRAFYNTALANVILPASLIYEGINAFDALTSKGYAGANPMLTHEASAERLSNFEYRENAYAASGKPVKEETLEPTLLVTELDAEGNIYTGNANAGTANNGEEASAGIAAYLEGIDDVYYLTVVREASSSVTSNEISKALSRAADFVKDRSLINGVYYDLELTDKSGIAITRLGHSALTVAIPVPEEIGSMQQITVMTVDRNGQLEEIIPEIISVDDIKYVRFVTYHLSPFALFGTCNLLDESMIVSENVAISALAAAPSESSLDGGTAGPSNFKEWAIAKKWRLIPAGILVIGGFVLIFVRFEKLRRR